MTPAVPTSPTPNVPPGSEGGIVRDSRPCTRCSYNLRGLPVLGACPECHQPVAHSMHGILLRYSTRPYLATLRRGHSLVLIGLVVSVATAALSSVAMYLVFRHNVSASAAGSPEISLATSWALSQIAGLVGHIIAFVGYLKATTPDANYAGIEKSDAPRKIVRGAVIAQLAVQVLSILHGLWRDGAAGTPESTIMFFGYILSLAAYGTWLTQFLAMMAYEHWLGTRVPDPRTVRFTRIYAWLLPLLIAMGFSPWLFSTWLAASRPGVIGNVVVTVASTTGSFLAFVLYCTLLNRMRRHLKSIEASGEPARLSGMFA